MAGICGWRMPLTTMSLFLISVTSLLLQACQAIPMSNEPQMGILQSNTDNNHIRESLSSIREQMNILQSELQTFKAQPASTNDGISFKILNTLKAESATSELINDPKLAFLPAAQVVVAIGLVSNSSAMRLAFYSLRSRSAQETEPNLTLLRDIKVLGVPPRARQQFAIAREGDSIWLSGGIDKHGHVLGDSHALRCAIKQGKHAVTQTVTQATTQSITQPIRDRQQSDTSANRIASKAHVDHCEWSEVITTHTTNTTDNHSSKHTTTHETLMSISPPPIFGHTLQAFNHSLYIYGGRVADGQVSNSVYRFDVDTSSWQKVLSTAEKVDEQQQNLDEKGHFNHSVFEYQGRMFVIGGHNRASDNTAAGVLLSDESQKKKNNNNNNKSNSNNTETNQPSKRKLHINLENYSEVEKKMTSKVISLDMRASDHPARWSHLTLSGPLSQTNADGIVVFRSFHWLFVLPSCQNGRFENCQRFSFSETLILDLRTMQWASKNIYASDDDNGYTVDALTVSPTAFVLVTRGEERNGSSKVLLVQTDLGTTGPACTINDVAVRSLARCSGRGICMSDLSCLCDSYYSGPDCLSDSPCGSSTLASSYACNHKGSCDAEQGVCVCADNTSGVKCEELKMIQQPQQQEEEEQQQQIKNQEYTDTCPIECKPGQGICMRVFPWFHKLAMGSLPQSFKCKCQNGWTGIECDIQGEGITVHSSIVLRFPTQFKEVLKLESWHASIKVAIATGLGYEINRVDTQIEGVERHENHMLRLRVVLHLGLSENVELVKQKLQEILEDKRQSSWVVPDAIADVQQEEDKEEEVLDNHNSSQTLNKYTVGSHTTVHAKNITDVTKSNSTVDTKTTNEAGQNRRHHNTTISKVYGRVVGLRHTVDVGVCGNRHCHQRGVCVSREAHEFQIAQRKKIACLKVLKKQEFLLYASAAAACASLGASARLATVAQLQAAFEIEQLPESFGHQQREKDKKLFDVEMRAFAREGVVLIVPPPTSGQEKTSTGMPVGVFHLESDHFMSTHPEKMEAVCNTCMDNVSINQMNNQVMGHTMREHGVKSMGDVGMKVSNVHYPTLPKVNQCFCLPGYTGRTCEVEVSDMHPIVGEEIKSESNRNRTASKKSYVDSNTKKMKSETIRLAAKVDKKKLGKGSSKREVKQKGYRAEEKKSHRKYSKGDTNNADVNHTKRDKKNGTKTNDSKDSKAEIEVNKSKNPKSKHKDYISDVKKHDNNANRTDPSVSKINDKKVETKKSKPKKYQNIDSKNISETVRDSSSDTNELRDENTKGTEKKNQSKSDKNSEDDAEKEKKNGEKEKSEEETKKSNEEKKKTYEEKKKISEDKKKKQSDEKKVETSIRHRSVKCGKLTCENGGECVNKDKTTPARCACRQFDDGWVYGDSCEKVHKPEEKEKVDKKDKSKDQQESSLIQVEALSNLHNNNEPATRGNIRATHGTTSSVSFVAISSSENVESKSANQDSSSTVAAVSVAPTSEESNPYTFWERLVKTNEVYIVVGCAFAGLLIGLGLAGCSCCPWSGSSLRQCCTKSPSGNQSADPKGAEAGCYPAVKANGLGRRGSTHGRANSRTSGHAHEQEPFLHGSH